MKKKQLKDSECKSRLNFEKGSGFDLMRKMTQKIEKKNNETFFKNRKYRESLEMKNVLKIKEDVSMNHLEYDEKFLKQFDKVLLDFILTKFTLKEIYIFTLSCEEGYIMSEVGLRLAKQQTVQIINALDSLSSGEKNRIKRKVWDTNYILFGLIINFVHRYEIFDGSESEIEVIRESRKSDYYIKSNELKYSLL